MSNIGKQKSVNARIWLSGVDTPERGERCFAEATERFKGPLGGGKGFPGIITLFREVFIL